MASGQRVQEMADEHKKLAKTQSHEIIRFYSTLGKAYNPDIISSPEPKAHR